MVAGHKGNRLPKFLIKINSKLTLPKKSDGAPLLHFAVDGHLYGNTAETQNVGKAMEYSKIPFASISTGNFNAKPKIRATSRVILVHETIGLQDQGHRLHYRFCS